MNILSQLAVTFAKLLFSNCPGFHENMKFNEPSYDLLTPFEDCLFEVCMECSEMLQGSWNRFILLFKAKPISSIYEFRLSMQSVLIFMFWKQISF